MCDQNMLLVLQVIMEDLLPVDIIGVVQEYVPFTFLSKLALWDHQKRYDGEMVLFLTNFPHFPSDGTDWEWQIEVCGLRPYRSELDMALVLGPFSCCAERKEWFFILMDFVRQYSSLWSAVPPRQISLDAFKDGQRKCWEVFKEAAQFVF